MVKVTSNSVIMLSIHPEYASAMFRGEKNIEFRKLNIPTTIEFVVLYATSPVKKVIGYFKVRNILKERPIYLWENFSKSSGTTKEFFFNYYREIDYGLGILIDSVNKFSRPFSLEKIGLPSKPPQSFLYIENDKWRKIKRRKISVNKTFHHSSLWSLDSPDARL